MNKFFYNSKENLRTMEQCSFKVGLTHTCSCVGFEGGIVTFFFLHLKNLKNFIVRWEKFFYLFFSLIPARKFRTSYEAAIALNFCVVCSLHRGGVIERWRILHHNYCICATLH